MRMMSFAILPHRTPRLTTLAQMVWFGLCSALLVVSWLSMAQAQQACTLSQITNATTPFGGAGTAMNANGTRIAFSYTGDLTPNNPGNPDGAFDIFLYDTTTGAFTQLTNNGGIASGGTHSPR